MGLHAAQLLGVDVPRNDKRLLVFVETDGCFSDGVSVAVGSGVGARTLRIVDFGKVAATFVDIETGSAVRLRPHPDARDAAPKYAPHAPSPWHAQRDGYSVMPTTALLQAESVALTAPLAAILGEDGVRVRCARCGEEIINGREVAIGGDAVCRGCVGDAYYTVQRWAEET
jgi:formylmethanofuran dehydrogenase subunit E